ncbi:MAG: DegT/DnrJ/EryC1/StrS family aminotransferase [Sneathiella sp.]|uniref:DegT/DnrJ/EryC1/StrS family aminotransferase n=1 Tax=Sneathiella sp. TaxID=1964365 RepID=UPI003002D1F8
MVFIRKQHCKNPTIAFWNLIKRPLPYSIPDFLTEIFPGKTVSYCANARAGIYEAVKSLNIGDGDHVLVPAFNCGSEVDPILVLKAEVTLFPVGKDTIICADEIASRIKKNTKAIYIIHYFGFHQPEMPRILELARTKGIPVIEDCALSLFSEAKTDDIEDSSDFSIYCFYKYYPVIGGGALVCNQADMAQKFNKPFPKRLERNTIIKSLLQTVFGEYIYRNLVNTAKRILRKDAVDKTSAKMNSRPSMPLNYYFNSVFDQAQISKVTKKLLLSYNPVDMVAARRRNFLLVQEELKDVKFATPLFSTLPKGVCPLSFPILVSKQEILCKALNEAQIDATPWWSGYHLGLDWDNQEAACFLKDHLISLPIHQYLEPKQIVYMIETLKKLLENNECQIVEFGERNAA